MRALFYALVCVGCTAPGALRKPEPALAPARITPAVTVRFLGTMPSPDGLFVCAMTGVSTLDCVDYAYFMRRLAEQQKP